MTRKRNMILAGVAVAAAAGLGTRAVFTAGGVPSGPARSPAGSASSVAYSAPGYSCYRPMMDGYDGSGNGMMAGGRFSGWMSLFANAPGPRVAPADARWFGSQAPAGAIVDRAARTITFTGTTVNLIVLASPSMPAESFRAARMTNPAISVPAGAHVSIELVNADADMAHGLVIMPAGAARSRPCP